MRPRSEVVCPSRTAGEPQIHADEKVATCTVFLTRAAAFFHAHGIPRIERVLTDNAWAYRKGLAWKQTLAEIGASGKLTRAYRPQTNGKVERFNRTLLDEWAYLQPYTSTTSGPQPSTPSCTPTTTIAATPHSEATPRSAASTTLRSNTPKGAVTLLGG
jgi:transposase InsO family protein